MKTKNGDLKIPDAITYILKHLVAIVLITSAISWGYWKLSTEPKIERKLAPIKLYVLENNLLLQEIVPVEKREKIRKRMECYKELK